MNTFTIGEQIPLPEDIKRLNDEEYGKSLARFRVSTIEVVIFYQEKVLLLQRLQPPLSGGWWLCGTKLIGAETLTQGAQRALKNELGLLVSEERFTEINKTQFINWAPSNTAPYGEHNQHNFCFVTLNEDEASSVFIREGEHANFTWKSLNEIVDPESNYIEPLVDLCSYLLTEKFGRK